MFRALFVAILAALLAPITARADEAWLLTTADFHSQRVTLKGLDASGAMIVAAEDGAGTPHEPEKVGLDRLLMLERTDRPQVSTAATQFAVILSGGDRHVGQPFAINGENLVWDTPALGKITLPLRSVTSIVRGDPTSFNSAAAVPVTEDIVTLLNRDSIRGIVLGIANRAVSMQQTGAAEPTPIPIESISRISFAATAPRPAAGRGFRVSLADGSALTVPSVQLIDGGKSLSMKLPEGAERRVLTTAVATIEQVNGPVVWLSSLAPSESIQKPFLDMNWPARMDRSVDGTAIRFGDRSYTRGIGVHSYSQLSFTIDSSWQTFRTQYSIAGDFPYASVSVRIKLDGKLVHEVADFRAGFLHPPVVLDLSGQKQLTLEVDYGENYDVQDRFNWIESAFLTFKPETTAPATQPNP